MGDPILARLPAMQLSGLMPHVTTRQIKAGEYLFQPGEEARSVFLIRDGRVLLDGARGQSLRDRGYIGIEAMLGSASYADAARAQIDTTVLVLPATRMTELANRQRDIRELFFRSYASPATGSDKTNPTPPAAESWAPLLGWLMAIALPACIYWIAPSWGLSPTATDFLAIIAATICMWLFSLVPEYVPPLFAALAMILLDVAPAAQVLSGFRSESFFASLSIFGIGALMVTSGLTYRFSLWVLSRVPETPTGYNLSLFGIGALLSPIIPSVLGRVSIVSPFLIELIQASNAGARDIFANRLIFSLVSGASVLVPLFLTAAVPNLVIYGLFDAQTQYAFGWLAWLQAALVFGACVLASFWIVSVICFRGARRFSVPRQTIAAQRRVLGPISRLEWAALLSVVAMMVGILTEQSHRIDVAWVALAVFVTLLLFGTMNREAIRAQIDWPILIYLGAIVGWVPAATITGLDQVIIGHLAWLGAHMRTDFPLFVLQVSGMILLVRLALPTGVTVILFATALFPLAMAQGMSLWVIGFIILAVADTYVFPYQSSYFLKLRSDLAQQGLDQICDMPRLIIANLALIALRIGAIYASLPYWQGLDLL